MLYLLFSQTQRRSEDTSCLISVILAALYSSKYNRLEITIQKSTIRYLVNLRPLEFTNVGKYCENLCYYCTDLKITEICCRSIYTPSIWLEFYREEICQFTILNLLHHYGFFIHFLFYIALLVKTRSWQQGQQ